MATLITTHSGPTYIEPTNKRSFTLRELQTLVGGHIEHLRTPFVVEGQPMSMFINEDGKRLGLPVNRFATSMMLHCIHANDVIVGDVVICSPTEAGEDDDEDEDDDTLHSA